MQGDKRKRVIFTNSFVFRGIWADDKSSCKMLYAYNFINVNGKAVHLYTQFSKLQLPCFFLLVDAFEFKLSFGNKMIFCK